ncbi:MAG: nucleotidyl transferase AbiEii/AbiGii toxin family protein, partial [Candidatus Binatia bacterium]
MGNSVLTLLQRHVLTSLFQNDLGRRGYYLTGGTALAEFYLHHRYSDDLDFFTRRQGRIDQDFTQFIDVIHSLGLTISSKTVSGEYLKLFVKSEGGDQEDLKIEFARDVPAQMAQSLV